MSMLYSSAVRECLKVFCFSYDADKYIYPKNRWIQFSQIAKYVILYFAFEKG